MLAGFHDNTAQSDSFALVLRDRTTNPSQSAQPVNRFYPYPFLDVAELGYGKVAVSIALVAALFTVLALLGRVLDRRLSRNLHPRSTT